MPRAMAWFSPSTQSPSLLYLSSSYVTRRASGFDDSCSRAARFTCLRHARAILVGPARLLALVVIDVARPAVLLAHPHGLSRSTPSLPAMSAGSILGITIDQAPGMR